MTVSKSHKFRLKELYYSLNILNDCSKLAIEGKVYHMIPIYGQLRNLLHIPKSESSKTTPLLLSLIEETGDVYEFYFRSLKGLHSDRELLNNTTLSYQELDFSLESKFGLIKTSISDFLSEDIFIYKGLTYTINDIFMTFSDKFGGSHYDLKIPSKYEQLYPLENNKLNILNKQILDFSDIIIRSGTKLLNKTNNFDIWLNIEISNLTPIKSCLLFITNELSSVLLIVQDSKLKLSFIDEQENLEEIELDFQIVENLRYNIIISHRLIEKLNSEITVIVNETIVYSEVRSALHFDNTTLFEKNYLNYKFQDYDTMVIKLFFIQITTDLHKEKFVIMENFFKENNKLMTEFEFINKEEVFEIKRAKV
jgi:hypothetical protein